MRPAKEFPAARKRFGETSILKLSFPRLIFTMRYQTLESPIEPRAYRSGLVKRTVQAFHPFQDSAVNPLLRNNNTKLVVRCSFSIV